jgi:hypothetical protein
MCGSGASGEIGRDVGTWDPIRETFGLDERTPGVHLAGALFARRLAGAG